MADTKISALTPATTVAGDELLPGVQSGANFSFTPQLLQTQVYIERTSDWTLALTDRNVDQRFNSASPLVCTIPLNSTVAFADGDRMDFIRLGSGTATIDAVSGVTLNGVDGDSIAIDAQYVWVRLKKVGTDAWQCSLVEGRTYTPATHASSHQSGGSDPIKLDDLAAPDDNTDLDATTSAHGLLPKLSGVSTEFLNGNGAFSTPAGGTTLDVQEFTSSGTWTKPANAVRVSVVLIGAGGGGCCGAANAATSVAGGSGGGGGRALFLQFDPDDLSATESVTIGAGGSGSAGVSSGFGSNATAGGNSTFAGAEARGGGAALNSPARGLGGGSYNLGAYPYFGINAESGSGGVSSTSSAAAGLSVVGHVTCTGGGAGGYINGSGTAQAGANGGRLTAFNSSFGTPLPETSAAAGGSVGNAGANGTKQLRCGMGGGGGGANAAGTAGNGGDGAYPGGGGGGGGAATTGNTSGSGGSGADGYCLVITECSA